MLPLVKFILIEKISFTKSKSSDGVSNNIRGVFMGGENPDTNQIEFITIGTTGNGTDFGDLTVARGFANGGSSGNGGHQ